MKLDKVTLSDILIPALVEQVTKYRDVEIFLDGDYLVIVSKSNTILENTKYDDKKTLLTGTGYWYNINNNPTINYIVTGQYTKLQPVIKDVIGNSNKQFNHHSSKYSLYIDTNDLRIAIATMDLGKYAKIIRKALVKDLNDSLGLYGSYALPDDVEILPVFNIKNFKL